MKTSTRRLLVNKKFVYAEKQLVHGVYSVEEVCEKTEFQMLNIFAIQLKMLMACHCQIKI